MINRFNEFCSEIYDHTRLLKPLCHIVGQYAYEEYNPQHPKPLTFPMRVLDIINGYTQELLQKSGILPTDNYPETQLRSSIFNTIFRVAVRKKAAAAITGVFADHTHKIKSIALLSPETILISALSPLSDGVTVIHCDKRSFENGSAEFPKVKHVFYDLSLPFRMIETLRCNAEKEDKMANDLDKLPFARIFSNLKLDQKFDCVVSFVSVVKITSVFEGYYQKEAGLGKSGLFRQSGALQVALMSNVCHLAKEYVLTADFTNPNCPDTLQEDAFKSLEDGFTIIERREIDIPEGAEDCGMDVCLYQRKPSNDKGDTKSNQS